MTSRAVIEEFWQRFLFVRGPAPKRPLAGLLPL